jgi:hypothetical protein
MVVVATCAAAPQQIPSTASTTVTRVTPRFTPRIAPLSFPFIGFFFVIPEGNLLLIFKLTD